MYFTCYKRLLDSFSRKRYPINGILVPFVTEIDRRCISVCLYCNGPGTVPIIGQ